MEYKINQTEVYLGRDWTGKILFKTHGCGCCGDDELVTTKGLQDHIADLRKALATAEELAIQFELGADLFKKEDDDG